MYIPKHFEITDNEEIVKFIEANGFGQLISLVEGKLFSTHIPFILSKDRTRIIGHVAKNNSQWKEIDGQNALVTLEGPHGYVSPLWYSTPNLPPTWNYQAIHIYGKSSTIHDTKKIKNIVHSLTAQYESVFDEPWQPSYDERMLTSIVGIELEITDIQCKYKLSQNRSDLDRKLVAERLEKLGATKLAKAMKARDQ
jgi:transcriptional regulator